MASKYSQKFPIPQGFPEILHDFTREVLRDQPEDLLDYATQYFECLHLKKPFHYDSKYNVKADNPQNEFHPHPKKEFDPERPPIKERPSRKEDTETSHAHSQATSHPEEKNAAKEYISGMNEGVLEQITSANRSEAEVIGETEQEEAKEGEEGEGEGEVQFRFYASEVSPLCFPVAYLLRKYGIPYEQIQVNPDEESERPIPTLEDGDQEVVGLSSCLLYICKKFEIEDTISPQILQDDNEIEQFLKFFINFEGALEQIRSAIEEHADIGQEEVESLEAFLQEIEENVLSKRAFLGSAEDITLADMVVIAHLSALLTSDYDFKKFPHVENWIKASLSSEIRDEFVGFFNNYRQAYELEGQNEVLAEL